MADEALITVSSTRELIPLDQSHPDLFSKKWPRRLNPKKQREADEQVADLLHLGVIEPTRSPWGSGVVMTKNRGPKIYRMCWTSVT